MSKFDYKGVLIAEDIFDELKAKVDLWVVNDLVIGIDQSYQCTGLSIAVGGDLAVITSIDLSTLKSNTEKRNRLHTIIKSLLIDIIEYSLSHINRKHINISCIVERIRTFGKGGISTDYIKSTGALIATIVDVCDIFSVKTYSVDTRAWKSKVVGTSKPANNNFCVPALKYPTVEYIIGLGFSDSIKKCVGEKKKKDSYLDNDGLYYKYDTDAADSACIALYWFLGDRDKLKVEK